jgi:starch phosphorylase
VRAGDDELRIQVELPGRIVVLRVWHVRAGHVDLYFLDADVPPNSGEDRGITYRLYGGDRAIRIEQELVLGIGGARVLAALNIEPAVWHINEGHAAFLILERARRAAKGGVDFATAVESVAGNTVFTTHTAVPAGHDRFELEMMQRYFAAYCSDVGIEMSQLLALGCPAPGASFDMTTLAIRGSRFHNAVSRIHAAVTAKMLQELWPQIPAEENPIDYVTNAVHVPTFLAPEWAAAFDRYLGDDWDQRLHEPQCIECLRQMPDEEFWKTHQALKSQMLQLVRNRVTAMHMRNHGSETHLTRLLRYADPDHPSVLTIGFARRFATYKRAGLLLADLDWLRQILGRQDRPVLFIFAGKAHPADIPGQDVIREIARIARMPEFEGKILLLEGYDLSIARRLVSGVDVWLNNPVFPLEASGTSGMKAGMNGVLNLSVLDGWWAEGYERGNGWGIKPVGENFKDDTRDREEAHTLYELLQDEVIPMYYERNGEGWPRAWINMARQSIITLLPRFGATRMVGEYANKLYLPAARRASGQAARTALARELTQWKTRVREAWPRVTLSRPVASGIQLKFGEALQLEVEADLAGLQANDLQVEFLLERPSRESEGVDQQAQFFTPSGNTTSGKQRYTLSLAPEFCGNLHYYVRAYPYHKRLAHRFELGLMIWA